MAMKESTKRLFEYLQKMGDEPITAADAAEALGVEKKSVDGSFTRGIQLKNYGYREEAEIELEDGSHKKVKFLRLNAEGKALDLDAPEA